MTPLLSSTVKVVLRIKKEAKSKSNKLHVEKKSDGKDCVMVNHDALHIFPFDKALNQCATQLDTYNAVIGNGIDLFLSGYHVSVFAYGQTGSGKTYSITGIENQPGILPLFAKNLFEKISRQNLDSSVYISLSFYEVYQEKVFDLLASNRKPLRVRGGTDDPYVEGLIEVGVKDEDELEKWRRTGLLRRSTAATLMNELSSRSHAIFSLKVQREYENPKRVVVSRCFFVDLAGSERLQTSGGHRTNESISINKSLLSLQRVVDARASNEAFVCYRDSVLTRLLKNCFDGNSATTLLTTVSPLECYSSETLNTLRFASKAAQVIQQPTINEEFGGESIADLRELNNHHLKKIAEMSAQIETLKQHCASVESVQAPAVLELFQDESLNQWARLENGIKFCILQNQLAEYFFENDKWNIRAFAAGVFVNGIALTVNSSRQLDHGDILSYYERKFCAVYLDEKCDPNKFISYDRAKLQYVTAVYEKQKEEMTEEIIAESKQNVKDVRDSLENELVSLRKELDGVKNKLKNKSEDQKYALKKEYDMVESLINDTEDVKKNLNDAVSKQTAIFKAVKEETEEDKMMHVGIKKVYAELNNEKFVELYEYFADLYQSDKTADEIIGEFNRFLYSSKYVWKPIRSGVGSSLLQTAVFNTLQETARKRRSTYAEVSRGFASRRSVIADIIQKPSERPTSQPIDELVQSLSFYALTAQRGPDTEEELGKLNEIGILLNVCITVRKNFDVFIAPENFLTAASIQKKAASIVGIYRSIGSLDALAATAQLCFITPSIADISLDYCPKEILERVNCLRQLIESWINAVREDTLSKDLGNLIFNEIDRIIQSVGFLAYFLGRRVEITDPGVQNEFRKGIMSAVKDLTMDVPEILERCDGEKTTREKFKKLAATFVSEILKYVEQSFDEDFIFEVVRRAILIKENMITLTEDRAGKMVEKIKDLIKNIEKFSTFVNPSSIELLKDGLKMWQQLSYISAKPPKSRAKS
uniref:Kinesin motor domain-containing protein n=1 Tax=Panagrolaimus superbus TaxID=310955 RepID=A0A914YEU3_9BILA